MSENLLMILALLLFVAVLASKVAYRFGAPMLLLFLGVGMFFGYYVIDFQSFEFAQMVGMLALCIILFSGGMDTKFSEIRPILAPGIVLATIGVGITAAIMGGFIYFFSSWVGLALSLPLSLLLASTMASTDSASVFSILRSKKQGLRQNLRPMLELESGSNDPMAYILTVLLLGVVLSSEGESPTLLGAVSDFFVEMTVGALMGYLIGRVAVFTINKVNIKNNSSLYSVLVLAFVYLSFSLTTLLWGNGYLAVYISGLVVGNMKIVNRSTVISFFDGFTLLAQIVMFLTIGLLVNTGELLNPDILLLGLAVGLFLMFVARPLAVMLSLLPFRRYTMRARAYVSWVGLRGAVPIIFATYPIVEGVDNAPLIFNVVFVVTLLSLLVQGTTVSSMANWLGLAYEEREPLFKVGLPDSIKSRFSEIEITQSMLMHGVMLRNITLPERTLIVMISRDGSYFVPRGNAKLAIGDRLLIASDCSEEELQKVYEKMGVEDVMTLN